MNRLTARDKHGHAYYPKCFEHPCDGERSCCTYVAPECTFEGKVLDRLAAYEDTGMEPEQIHGWIPVWERLPDKNGCYLISYTDYDNKTDEIAKVEICEFAKDNDIDVEFWKSGFDAWMPLPEPYREG